MKASSLIEVLSAAHLSKYVESNVFEQRGGIFLIAPPGSLKSRLITNSLKCFPDCLRLSDLNVQSLGYLKSSFIDGKFSTMAFGEFEKLYQRNPATAANLEGHLKAMVEEGFGKESFVDQRAITFESRILLVAGVTPTCYQQRLTKWIENGFGRRFLWSSYVLDDPEIIVDAIHRWRSLNFGKAIQEAPSNGTIPYSLTSKESLYVKQLVSGQVARETPYVLMKKILCVLKWRHGSAKKAMLILEDFAESLGDRPARLIV